MAHNIDPKNTTQELTVVEQLVIVHAKKILQETVLKELDWLLDKAARDAVQKYAEIRMQVNKDASNPFGNDELHITFIQKVIETVETEYPIFVHDEKKQK